MDKFPPAGSDTASGLLLSFPLVIDYTFLLPLYSTSSYLFSSILHDTNLFVTKKIIITTRVTKNVPWHILAPATSTLYAAVRILAERFFTLQESNFL